MNHRFEVYGELGETIAAAINARLMTTWTSLPAIIDSFNPQTMTCEAHVALNFSLQTPKGNIQTVTMPTLVDLPVIFPSGGGYTLTFPIASGDECLLVFASRCIDNWWLSGGVQGQAEFRMHDISDAFVLVGPRSQPRVIPNVNTANVELRNDEGTTYFAITPNADIIIEANFETKTVRGNSKNTVAGDVTNAISGQLQTTSPSITINADSDMTINCPNTTWTGNINMTGNLNVTGTITASVSVTTPTIATASIAPMAGGGTPEAAQLAVTGSLKAGGKELINHAHPYSWTDGAGSGTTGPNQ